MHPALDLPQAQGRDFPGHPAQRRLRDAKPACRAPGTRPARYSTSEAKSASRERSPRASVTCPLCGQPLKRSTA